MGVLVVLGGWQDYSVPRACIEAGWHYIDLADARTFVCGIGEHMLAIFLAAWAVRMKLIRSLAAHVPRLHRLALARARNGSRHSAMQVTVRGRDRARHPHRNRLPTLATASAEHWKELLHQVL